MFRIVAPRPIFTGPLAKWYKKFPGREKGDGAVIPKVALMIYLLLALSGRSGLGILQFCVGHHELPMKTDLG